MISKKEFTHVGLLVAAIYIALQVAFYKENPLQVIRVAAMIGWLFVLPGYAIMLSWPKLPVFERLVIGTLMGAAVVGILSYYLGLSGLALQTQVIILPPLLIGAGYSIRTRLGSSPTS